MQPARITIRESITHQVMVAGDPTTFESRASEWLSLKEQPYYRTRTVGETWERVELGWLKSCSLLILRNVWEQPTSMPTAEQSVEASRRVIDVVLDRDAPTVSSKPAFSISAGMSARVPMPMVDAWIRSRHDSETTVSIIAIPR